MRIEWPYRELEPIKRPSVDRATRILVRRRLRDSNVAFRYEAPENGLHTSDAGSCSQINLAHAIIHRNGSEARNSYETRVADCVAAAKFSSNLVQFSVVFGLGPTD